MRSVSYERAIFRAHLERNFGVQQLQLLTAARVTAWALTTVIVALSLVPPTLRPETGLPHNIEHFIIYWATGVAFSLSYERRRDLMAALLVLFCATVEVSQIFVPGRHARLSDFIVDALAMWLGVMTPSMISLIRVGR